MQLVCLTSVFDMDIHMGTIITYGIIAHRLHDVGRDSICQWHNSLGDSQQMLQ